MGDAGYLGRQGLAGGSRPWKQVPGRILSLLPSCCTASCPPWCGQLSSATCFCHKDSVGRHMEASHHGLTLRNCEQNASFILKGSVRHFGTVMGKIINLEARIQLPALSAPIPHLALFQSLSLGTLTAACSSVLCALHLFPCCCVPLRM